MGTHSTPSGDPRHRRSRHQSIGPDVVHAIASAATPITAAGEALEPPHRRGRRSARTSAAAGSSGSAISSLSELAGMLLPV